MTGNTEIQTAATARKQIDANPHINVRSVKSSGRFAVQFDKERFEMALLKASAAFREVTDELNARDDQKYHIAEAVYEAPILSGEMYVVRVYSTVRTRSTVANRRNTSRRKGDDAIRVQIVRKPSNDIVAAAPKTLRIATVDDDGDVVQNWERNMLRKIEEFTGGDVIGDKVQDCPEDDCDGYLHRRKGKHGYFLGCSEYEYDGGCDHTEDW